MKKLFTTFSFKVIFIILLLSTSFSYSQIPIFDDDVDDENPAAPITSLLVVGLIAGSIYGIKKIKK